MRILAVVLSCMKHHKLWKHIAARMDKDILIFVGGSESTHFDEPNKILYLKCGDTYDRLPEKIICMIHTILNMDCFSDVTHIIKIDDYDTMWDKSHIDNLYTIAELKTYHYIGQTKHLIEHKFNGTYHYNKVRPSSYWFRRPYVGGNIVEYLLGGDTYILSRHAMILINNTYNTSHIETIYKTHIYEDLMIGQILAKHDIFPIVINYKIKCDILAIKNRRFLERNYLTFLASCDIN